MIGNFPGRSPNAFFVLMKGVIVAIISFVSILGESDGGEKSWSVNCCVLCRFYRSCFRCPKCVAIVGVKIFLMMFGVNPGHEIKFPFFTAFKKVAIVGEKHAA